MVEFVPPLSRSILHSVAQWATTHRDEQHDSAALDQIADRLQGGYSSPNLKCGVELVSISRT